jgi:cellulose synthase/poly-beta-1,6-N-acetylglucosamine synthase-like glycosyltransferase
MSRMEFVTPVVILCTILLFVVMVFVFSAFPFGFEGSAMFTNIKQWSTSVTDTVGSVLVRLEEHFWLYVPLGLIGIWRWLTWGFKRACAEYYRPIDVQPCSSRPSLCIITPVYNENPQIFKRALDSWEANSPDEVIAVIDRSDKNCIEVYKEFSRNKKWAKLLVTAKRGKRQAIVDGVLASNSKIVALVDSDTVWASGITRDLLAPFSDPLIAGVTPRNHPLRRSTIWQKMTDIFWDIRNYYDLPSQTAMGSALTCLTGRTSLYRREILLPKLDEFLNEILLGKRKESGEDKCFTRLVQREGWKTYYQMTAVIYSAAAPDFETFLSQRLRWTRNSHNSDLVSLLEGWAWKRPYLAFYMVDRFISTFTLFLGPIFFGVAIYLNQWVVALAILCLWIVGRGIKILPHLKRYPQDLFLLPIFVAVYFLIALIKLYALVSIREQKWIRENGSNEVRHSRMRQRIYHKTKDMILTTEIIGGLVILVVFVLR